MTKVFLSRPNWIAPEFEAGHRAFEKVLSDLKIAPQTIGVTHHPQGSPMDAVIEVMDECDGAIVLGYPQLEIAAGKCKSQPIVAPLLLATEWNHIEAGLAYARGLPLLFIHHQGVSRGVFDRGALNKFLYSADLSIESWALSDQIHPAIVEWKEKIDKERRSKRRKDK